jgi:hypothetical protein
MDSNAISTELIQHEDMKGWSAATLSIWLRDSCRCVYCDQNMLESRLITYHASCLDHLLPKSIYTEIPVEADWNLVLACQQCNILKGRWDPNTEGERLYFAGILGTQDRRKMIERVKLRIRQSLADLQKIFEEQKKRINEVVSSVKAQSASGQV